GLRTDLIQADGASRDMLLPERERELGPVLHESLYSEAWRGVTKAMEAAGAPLDDGNGGGKPPASRRGARQAPGGRGAAPRGGAEDGRAGGGRQQRALYGVVDGGVGTPARRDPKPGTTPLAVRLDDETVAGIERVGEKMPAPAAKFGIVLSTSDAMRAALVAG